MILLWSASICFGKAGFEVQVKEENYDFDFEGDFTLSVTAEINTMNQLEVESATLMTFYTFIVAFRHRPAYCASRGRRAKHVSQLKKELHSEVK